MGRLEKQRISGRLQQLAANLTVPVITGTPTVGQTLTATDGTWSAFPAVAFTRQWFWADTSAARAGATSATYVLVAGDATHTIKCTVTATNHLGSTAASSANTAAVAV